MKYHNKWDTKQARLILDAVLSYLNEIVPKDFAPTRYSGLQPSYVYVPVLDEYRIVISWGEDPEYMAVMLDAKDSTLETLKILTLEVFDDRYLMSICWKETT